MAHLATVRAQLIKATALSLTGSSAAGTFSNILRAGESPNLFSHILIIPKKRVQLYFQAWHAQYYQ